MRSGYAQTLVRARQRSEHLCAFLYLETVLTEVTQLLMGGRNSGCIDNQTGSLVAACLRNLVHILVIVNHHAFLFQLACQRRRRLVVSCNDKPPVDEVSGYGAHADAACPYKINGFNIFQFHFLILFLLFVLLSFRSMVYFPSRASLITSSAMASAEFFSASFRMFSCSDSSLAALLMMPSAVVRSTSGASASFT